GLSVYQDRDARQVLDYQLGFKRLGAPDDTGGLLARLGAAALNSTNQPLQGLRIALDPGHMGGKLWDEKTGKFVHTAIGYVSEGVIAFDVCMLLGRELTALGADVMVTRHELGPVTEQPLESYNLIPWGEREIRNSSDVSWFENLLNSAPLGHELFALFDHSAMIKKITSEAQRENYFISRLDLSARAEKINAFRPQLTVVVHFDASELNKTQDATNTVRGYVAGNLMHDEVGSRELRFQAVRNLVDGHRWVESSVFTAAVIKNLSDALHVKMETGPNDYMAIRVADGVYARNLALSRLVTQGVMTYVEVEHYDFTPEFRRLNLNDRHTEIGGTKIDYPARLDDIVDGFKRGILDYVGSMAQRPLARL
ncbi:MAG: N-acetylmuramoyl-L-alanine amidase, partial [Deltaproteobacteria bacterium]|nr:N-acetylmuramoyl-L-alanine amidase [Deltaproteobacteria bacterium]